jgi:hypothetical protein
MGDSRWWTWVVWCAIIDALLDTDSISTIRYPKQTRKALDPSTCAQEQRTVTGTPPPRSCTKVATSLEQLRVCGCAAADPVSISTKTI